MRSERTRMNEAKRLEPVEVDRKKDNDHVRVMVNEVVGPTEEEVEGEVHQKLEICNVS